MYDIQTYSLSPFLNPHINVLRTTGYHFIDYVQYSTTTVQKFKFKYVRQLNGGFKTDFDLPFKNSKFFKKKFGEGDLRILFQKIK